MLPINASERAWAISFVDHTLDKLFTVRAPLEALLQVVCGLLAL